MILKSKFATIEITSINSLKCALLQPTPGARNPSMILKKKNYGIVTTLKADDKKMDLDGQQLASFQESTISQALMASKQATRSK